MGCCCFSLTNLVLLGFFIFVLKQLFALYKKWKVEKMLEKWDQRPTPKDKVILHTTPRCVTTPSASPFALKLETYLRMAKIPYELDHEDMMGPKGKLPWITFNGVHVADSELVIRYLNKKLGINLDKDHSDEQTSVARACRIVLEDHFLWGLILYRWIDNQHLIGQVMKLPMVYKLFMPMMKCSMRKRLDSQGIGKHTPTEIYQMTDDDLRIVSKVLGKKKFFGGDKPCEEDCGLFGNIAQAVWAAPGSSFERLAHGELVNLKEYCERMRDLVWPDWENCLDKIN